MTLRTYTTGVGEDPHVRCRDCRNYIPRGSGIHVCDHKHVTISNANDPRICSHYIKATPEDREAKCDVTVKLSGTVTATVHLFDVPKSVAEDYDLALDYILKNHEITPVDIDTDDIDDWTVMDVEDDL